MTDEQALRLDERLARIEATLSTHGTKIDTCLLALHHGNITLVALTEQVLALNGRGQLVGNARASLTPSQRTARPAAHGG